MSDFLKGVGTGLAGSNGIAGAIQKMAMLPYYQQQAKHNAMYKNSQQAVNDVKVRESEQKMKYVADVIEGLLDRNKLAGAMAAGDGKAMYSNSNVKGAALDMYNGSMPVGNQVAFDNEQNLIKAKTAHEGAERIKAVNQAYKALRPPTSSGGGRAVSGKLITDENGYHILVNPKTGSATYLKDDSGLRIGSPKKGGRASGRQGRSEASGAQSSDSGITYDEARAVAAQQVKAGAIPWNKADNILRNSFGKGFDK